MQKVCMLENTILHRDAPCCGGGERPMWDKETSKGCQISLEEQKVGRIMGICRNLARPRALRRLIR